MSQGWTGEWKIGVSSVSLDGVEEGPQRGRVGQGDLRERRSDLKSGFVVMGPCRRVSSVGPSYKI